MYNTLTCEYQSVFGWCTKLAVLIKTMHGVNNFKNRVFIPLPLEKKPEGRNYLEDLLVDKVYY
jgi:hypothetical protein